MKRTSLYTNKQYREETKIPKRFYNPALADEVIATDWKSVEPGSIPGGRKCRPISSWLNENNIGVEQAPVSENLYAYVLIRGGSQKFQSLVIQSAEQLPDKR